MDTRFRPTAYRDMHCGHALMAYRNWETARLTGGKFIVIFDDTIHRATGMDKQGFTPGEAATRWCEDLAWLGIGPDLSVFSEELAPARDEVLRDWGLRLPVAIGKNTGCGHWIELPWPHPTRGGHYSEAFVVGRVVDDRTLGVDGFWRGLDLKGEEQLYSHWGRVLGYPQVAQGYLSLVARTPNGKESQSIGDISVRSLREAGYQPWQIIGTLLECARVSLAEGHAATMIPPGYLAPEAVRWLEWREDPQYLEDTLKGAEGKPWEATVQSWVAKQQAGLGIQTGQ
jgi:hypothetical protein